MDRTPQADYFSAAALKTTKISNTSTPTETKIPKPSTSANEKTIIAILSD